MSHAQQHVLASAIVLAILVVFGIHVFLFPMYTSSPAARRVKISVYEQALCHSNLKNPRAPPPESPCPRFGIVSAAQGGRLGNQIWEYASVWATARSAVFYLGLVDEMFVNVFRRSAVGSP